MLERGVKTRQDKARQDKTRQDKTRQDRSRQDKTGVERGAEKNRNKDKGKVVTNLDELSTISRKSITINTAQYEYVILE